MVCAMSSYRTAVVAAHMCKLKQRFVTSLSVSMHLPLQCVGVKHITVVMCTSLHIQEALLRG